MGSIPPVDGETVIRSLNQSIKLFSAPFSRNGVAEIGVRMSAIQTKEGIILYNPVNLDTPTTKELQEMTGQTASQAPLPPQYIIAQGVGGPAHAGTSHQNNNRAVKYIIAPSLVHHSFLDAAHAAFPEAFVVGPQGLHDKHKGIRKFIELTDPNGGGVPGFPYEELQLAYFPDFIHKDICMFHNQSKTLFVCDMLFNLPAHEQYANVADKSRVAHKGIIQKFAENHLNASSFDSDWVAKAMQWTITKTTDAFKQQADRMVNQWKPEVIVPQHGDVIDREAAATIKHRFATALGEK